MEDVRTFPVDVVLQNKGGGAVKSCDQYITSLGMIHTVLWDLYPILLPAIR